MYVNFRNALMEGKPQIKASDYFHRYLCGIDEPTVHRQAVQGAILEDHSIPVEGGGGDATGMWLLARGTALGSAINRVEH